MYGIESNLRIYYIGGHMENNEIKYYQPRFAKWIASKKWDAIIERLSDTNINIIIRVMNAKKDGDCNWLVWRQCDNVLDSIKRIASQIK